MYPKNWVFGILVLVIEVQVLGTCIIGFLDPQGIDGMGGYCGFGES